MTGKDLLVVRTDEFEWFAGHSDDPWKLLDDLQARSTSPVQLVICVPTCGNLEAEIGEKFKSYRLNSGWYLNTGWVGLVGYLTNNFSGQPGFKKRLLREYTEFVCSPVERVSVPDGQTVKRDKPPWLKKKRK